MFRISIRLMVIVATTAVMAACKSTPPPNYQMVELEIETNPTTNDGRLMYCLVRRVSQKPFLSDSYSAAAKHVFSDPKDPSVVMQQRIVPGEDTEMVVDNKRGPIAIYFFFTDPGKRWKAFIPFSEKKNGYTFILGAREIKTIE